MQIRSALIAVIAAAVVSGCGKDSGTTDPTVVTPPPPPPPPTVFLQDIVIPNLPSPYYHFEYDPAGRLSVASFASGLTMYEVKYNQGHIIELDNSTAGNRDRLVYNYDNAGQVLAIRYVNTAGVTTTAVIFSYDGGKLTGVERDRMVEAGFITDKTMSFSYYADGNVREITEYRPRIEGRQDETTTVDRYENYDTGINVDGFDLLHTEFFDHLLLLPGVQLQEGNPGRVTHTGDGDNYTVDYIYTYDANNRPLTKSGDLVFLNGPNVGRRFQTLSQFSYY